MSNLLRALLCGAALAVLAAPAFAAEPLDAQDPNAVEGLVVTATRRQTPATQEGVTAPRIDETVNAMNVEDTVKYLPSLIVRKRHVGDTQAPLAVRTSGLGSSARTLIYADGVLLSALIGNNNSTASPRWGMVAPEEVESVSFLYGPFAAAYAGNSVGGVLNIRTATPMGREAAVHVAGSVQSFGQYASDDDYGAAQLSASYGDRIGGFWFRLSGNLVESNSQPVTYVTAARSANASTAGTSVTGAFVDKSRTGAPIAVFGAGGLERQTQTLLKAKAGYDLPFATLAYTVANFANDTSSDVQPYAVSSAGAPVYSGTLNQGGYAYGLGASAFSNSVYEREDSHWMHSLTAASRGDGPLSWSLSASLYDYGKDAQRNPTGALPGGLSGPGTISRLDGTGWRTLDGQATRKLGEHSLTAGAHWDEVELASRRNNTAEWRSGAIGALTQEARGKTEAKALFVQDRVSLGDDFKATFGLRYEDWRAFDGFNFSASPALSVKQPALSASKFSPKAAIEWAGAKGWSATAAYGEAYRFPTVSELYQVVSTGPTLSVPNPKLAPEHARSAELAVQHGSERGRIRVSLFTETVTDALVSQSAQLVPGSTAVFNFVQNIGETRVNGVEIAAERRDVLIKGFDLSGSATLVDPTVEENPVLPASEGKRLPGVPKFKATLVGTYRPNEDWSFSLAGRYSDRAYATIDNSDVLTHTYQGFDPYFVADARVTYRIDDHWEAAVGVDNLFDRRYFLFHPFPGRTVLAELNWRF